MADEQQIDSVVADVEVINHTIVAHPEAISITALQSLMSHRVQTTPHGTAAATLLCAPAGIRAKALAKRCDQTWVGRRHDRSLGAWGADFGRPARDLLARTSNCLNDFVFHNQLVLDLIVQPCTQTDQLRPRKPCHCSFNLLHRGRDGGISKRASSPLQPSNQTIP